MFKKIIALLVLGALVGVAWGHAHSLTPDVDERTLYQLLAIIAMATAAHVFGGLVQKWTGLSEIVGWMLLGIALTNLPIIGPAVHASLGNERYELEHAIAKAEVFGVWLLMAEAGLETDLNTLVRNIGRGSVVALIGVVIPGLIVYLALPFIFPELSPVARLLVAAMFTPTSLGVATIFFKKEGVLASSTAQLVIAVAAIDDVIGLANLSAIDGMRTGSVSPAAIVWIIVKVVIFFGGSLFAGSVLAPIMSNWMARLNGGEAMRLKFALGSCLLFAWIAHSWGLSVYMGAYAGGVFLTSVHFREFGSGEEHGVEDLLKGMKYILVPVFITSVAMKVDLRLLFALQPLELLVTGIVGLVIGKMIGGQLAGQGNDKATLTWGSLVRGEVVLVMAKLGYDTHLIGQAVMSVAVMAMVISIVITSVMLPKAIKRAVERIPGIFKPTMSPSHA
ncbi:cation:proton antiporter [Patescibacteria group bacterium]|nr:cation:proton antiporter [Patescibacteria group bacterium]